MNVIIIIIIIIALFTHKEGLTCLLLYVTRGGW